MRFNSYLSIKTCRDVAGNEVVTMYADGKPVWFAVQLDPSDDWGTGSYDWYKAKKMLLDQGQGQIVLVAQTYNYCVKDAAAYVNKVAIDEYSYDEVIEGLDPLKI